jgi:beta-glucosidase
MIYKMLLICISTILASLPPKVIYNSTFKTPFQLVDGHLPKDFLYGYASAAAQVEGAYNVDGKSASIWDKFAREKRDRIVDGSRPDVANNEYGMVDETVALLKVLGANSYRFSIAWTRLVPEGR